MKARPVPHHTRFGTLGLLGAAVLFLTTATAGAKLAAERWTRLTEEERHQMTRAERYVDQSNYKSALSEYELFIQLYPKSEVASYAQLMLAEATRRLGQVNAAINEFRNVIDYFPDSIDAGTAQYSIGVCQTQTGDAEQAVVSFEKVIAKWPKADFGALARSEVCTIYWRLGKTEKWLPHMDYLATGEYTDVQNLRHSSQRRLMMHRLFQNQIPEAFALVDQTRKKDALTIFSEWTYDSLRHGHFRNAYAEAGTKIAPTIGTNAAAFIEKQSAAVTDAAQRTAYDQWCARILSSAGIVDKATERFAALSKKNPDNDVIRTEYADHLRVTGKRPEARLVYHELKDQYVAGTHIAETYGEENNWKSCIEAYQKMLGKHPDKVGVIQWRLGEILQRNGRYPEAIASYQQTQREPESLFRVADCQSALKQHDTAIQTLVGVLNFFKSAAPEAQYRIAVQHAAKGDKEAAIRTLKTVCKVYLNTSWAATAHQELTLKYGVDVTLGGAAKKDDK